jgi:hypothetical protein
MNLERLKVLSIYLGGLHKFKIKPNFNEIFFHFLLLSEDRQEHNHLFSTILFCYKPDSGIIDVMGMDKMLGLST